MDSFEVDITQRWECCNCGWIGTHADARPAGTMDDEVYQLVCPKCASDEFYMAQEE